MHLVYSLFLFATGILWFRITLFSRDFESLFDIRHFLIPTLQDVRVPGVVKVNHIVFWH